MSEMTYRETNLDTGESKRKIIHMCQSVRGALKNWDKNQWKQVAQDNGMSVERCKEWFRIQEHNGVKVIPFGERCEGFSDIDGCPGHEVLK